MYVLIYVAIAVAILLIWYISLYNGLIYSRQKVEEAASGMEVQVKRRHDLIPALVETVKAYAEHESQVLKGTAEARVLKSAIAVAEAYPDLKSDKNFLNLQQQLAETEDQISASRRIYNGNATILNTKIESFPSSIPARLHGVKKVNFFDADV